MKNTAEEDLFPTSARFSFTFSFSHLKLRQWEFESISGSRVQTHDTDRFCTQNGNGGGGGTVKRVLPFFPSLVYFWILFPFFFPIDDISFMFTPHSDRETGEIESRGEQGTL